VIVSQALARQLSPDRSPIGGRLAVNGGSTIIGIAASVHHGSLEEAGGGEMYLEYRQSGDWSSMELVVRSSTIRWYSLETQDFSSSWRSPPAPGRPSVPPG
jgi:hypothetical protein